MQKIKGKNWIILNNLRNYQKTLNLLDRISLAGISCLSKEKLLQNINALFLLKNL